MNWMKRNEIRQTRQTLQAITFDSGLKKENWFNKTLTQLLKLTFDFASFALINKLTEKISLFPQIILKFYYK